MRTKQIKQMYTLDEVAETLQLTKRTIYTYIKTGKLKAVKMGKYWRVSEETLNAFMESGTSQPQD